MSDVQRQCQQIIMAVDGAKAHYIRAIQEAREGRFLIASQMMEDGKTLFNQGHLVHASLIRKATEGEPVAVSLLLICAEDHLMNTETFQIVAIELVENYKRISALELTDNVS